MPEPPVPENDPVVSRSYTAPVTIQKSPSQPPRSSQSPPPIALSPNAVQPPQPQANATVAEKAVRVYWLKGTGNQIALAPVTVKVQPTIDQPDAVLQAAITHLLAKPAEPNTSTIPPGTKLLGVKLEDDGIHINLSRDFVQGGGTASMTGRVAQILYTATTLQPNAAVWLAVEGKPLEVLGGEGLMLDQPLSRENFERNFSL